MLVGVGSGKQNDPRQRVKTINRFIHSIRLEPIFLRIITSIVSLICYLFISTISVCADRLSSSTKIVKG